MKAIITGALQATQDDLNALRSMGLEITIHPDERQEVTHPEQFEIAICNGLFLYNDIRRFTQLKYVQLTSAGMDRVPLDYIQHNGITLHNAAGVYSIPMAEWTLMRILELYKNAENTFENQKIRRWEKDRFWQELAGKTACIVGFGAYGMETAKRLKSFGVTVTVVNRTEKESPWADAFFPLEALDTALGQADIVILAIALTEQTRHLINEERFAAMKQNALFLNAARGSLVDEDALLHALQAGKLSGAALDVFETEPLPADSALWRTQNLLLSAHNSFVGERNHHRLMNVVLNHLKEIS